MLTVREALRQPLTKPAVRKLLMIVETQCDPQYIVERWFVLKPDPTTNAVAIPCSSFDVAMAVVGGLR
jgi:hypothetical protein